MDGFNLTTFALGLVREFGVSGVFIAIVFVQMFINRKERERTFKSYVEMNDKSTQALIKNTEALTALKTVVEMKRD